ncbi:hypothetical protein PG985_013940 [Apiospora marii]|uniref:Uncharacterized protein n=1 Tax=Apiospora marii TaxID=335849 RepID=A0ABR1R6F5_9PEZI
MLAALFPLSSFLGVLFAVQTLVTVLFVELVVVVEGTMRNRLAARNRRITPARSMPITLLVDSATPTIATEAPMDFFSVTPSHGIAVALVQRVVAVTHLILDVGLVGGAIVVVDATISLALLVLSDTVVQLLDLFQESDGSLGGFDASVKLVLQLILPGVVLGHAGHGILLEDRGLLQIHTIALGCDLLADSRAQVDDLVNMEACMSAADAKIRIELLNSHLLGLNKLVQLVNLLLEVAACDLLLAQMLDKSALVLDLLLVAIDQVLGQIVEVAVGVSSSWELLEGAEVVTSINTLGALLFAGLVGGVSVLGRRRMSGIDGRIHDEIDDLECLALDRA